MYVHVSLGSSRNKLHLYYYFQCFQNYMYCVCSVPYTRLYTCSLYIIVAVIPLPTQNQSLLQLNSDLIHSIKRGVEFGRMLQLPESVSFNSEHMADILTAGGTVRPFNQIKSVQ